MLAAHLNKKSASTDDIPGLFRETAGNITLSRLVLFKFKTTVCLFWYIQ